MPIYKAKIFNQFIDLHYDETDKAKLLKLIDALTLNPSLDIDTVNNLIKSNQANINNVKNFFNIFYKKKEDYVLKIKDKLFRSNFEKFLIKNKLAGNIIIIGKKV